MEDANSHFATGDYYWGDRQRTDTVYWINAKNIWNNVSTSYRATDINTQRGFNTLMWREGNPPSQNKQKKTYAIFKLEGAEAGMSVGSPVEEHSFQQGNKGQRPCWSFDWQAGELDAHSSGPAEQPMVARGMAGPHFWLDAD